MEYQLAKKEDNVRPYQELVQQISTIYTQGRVQAVAAAHGFLVDTYWNIGYYIVEYEQKGKEKAVYGTKLLANLSRDLSLLHGKGFSRPNLNNMRMFYLRYPICQKPSDKLGNISYTCPTGKN